MKKAIFLILVLFSVFIIQESVVANCNNNLTDPLDDGVVIMSDDTYSYSPFADISSTWMRPAENYPAMEFGVITKEEFKTGNGDNFNIFFFLDMDSDPTNNDQTGTRAGSDTAFSLLWGVENQEWKTASWTYDSPNNKWFPVTDGSILFMPLELENGFIIHVPFELVPKNTDVPFKTTIAISKDKKSMMDSVPDGEGIMNDCNKELITIIPKNNNNKNISDSPLKKETNSIIFYILFTLIAIVFFGGLAKVIKKNKDNSAPEEDKITCKCNKCSLYICVGSSSDRAIGSALNLGKAIKRDTEVGGKKRCCVKIMHFKNKDMKYGRYVGYSKSNKLEWKKFKDQEEARQKDGHSDICIWNEVMIVMHGEKKSKVKSVVKKISELIPKAPIKRLVLYYCGGGATLPEAEFNLLGSELGKRLKKIPKECRPKNVELLIAPTVSFNDEPSYTVLSINQSGLTSFEGKMMQFLSNEKGVVTRTGNKVPSGRLFGCVELGNLESTTEANASTYLSSWKRICKLKLSEIRKYREYIKRAKLKTEKGKPMDPPPFCKKEVKAAKIEKTLEQYNTKPFSQDELDSLVEMKTKEIKKIVKNKIKVGN